MSEKDLLFGAEPGRKVSTHALRKLHQEFLSEWSIDRLESMTLDEYVGVGDRNTFCQWVETRTRPLGSIKGNNSLKFGIYKRQADKKPPKRCESDRTHSWRKVNGKNQTQAFNSVRRKVAEVARLADRGKFSDIENIDLNDLFKWKVAFLYSRERLLPIYNSASLREISQALGVNFPNRKQRTSALLEIVDLKKPSLSIYEYAHDLYEKYGIVSDRRTKSSKKKANKKGRKGTTNFVAKGGKRKGSAAGYYQDNHTPLQETLYEELKVEFPDARIEAEDNYVDLKVWLPNKILFFEVKTSGTASENIKDGLGQVLAYVNDDGESLEKEIVIAGAPKATTKDREFIEFLKGMLGIEFSYRTINIDEK